ncbi:hypothetical protein IE077_001979 [Cardiosporidium cionae]|uniref:KIF-binding protein n=1 Tax=Cardiosporidium cionae TaxID=476202 RepID=A0ABQ7JBZ6_9APIC|nr:hypothetical protein IE077_001979 [Cardiosporidium cionae]|eukprot:KAF8821479.1 hypothetical protein IE077_001979 [Cardiosporidium cionae]
MEESVSSNALAYPISTASVTPDKTVACKNELIIEENTFLHAELLAYFEHQLYQNESNGREIEENVFTESAKQAIVDEQFALLRTLLEKLGKEIKTLQPPLLEWNEISFSNLGYNQIFERAKALNAVAIALTLLGKNYADIENLHLAEARLKKSLQFYSLTLVTLTPCFNESYFTSAIQSLLKHTAAYMLDALNQLGYLYCNDKKLEEGMKCLHRAEVFANSVNKILHDFHQGNLDLGIQQQVILTDYYLTQSFINNDNIEKGARYCLQTLKDQLSLLYIQSIESNSTKIGLIPASTAINFPEWIRNCCKQSDQYINSTTFWTAEYLLLSAEVVLTYFKKLHSKKTSSLGMCSPADMTELEAEVHRDIGQLYHLRLQISQKALSREPTHDSSLEQSDSTQEASSSTIPIVEEVSGMHFGLETFSLLGHDPNNPNEDEKDHIQYFQNDLPCIILLQLETFFPVSVLVYFPEFHLQILQRMKLLNNEFINNANLINLPQSLISQRSYWEKQRYLAFNFQAARALFKLAFAYCKSALKFYQLDGFATDNIRLTMRISSLYRLFPKKCDLIYFESDPHRVSLMMLERLKHLSPLLDVLNPRYYLQYIRSIAFECGTVGMEYTVVKWPGKAVNPKMQKKLYAINLNAAKHFDLYLKSFEKEDKTKEPIEDKEQTHYTYAQFSRLALLIQISANNDVLTPFMKRSKQELEELKNHHLRHPEISQNNADLREMLVGCDEMIRLVEDRFPAI